MLGRRDRGPERHVNFVRPGRRGHTPANEVNNSVCARRRDLLSRLTRAYRLVWYLGPGHYVERLPGTMPWNDVLDADVPEPGDLLGMSESRCSGGRRRARGISSARVLERSRLLAQFCSSPDIGGAREGRFAFYGGHRTLRDRSMRPSYSVCPAGAPAQDAISAWGHRSPALAMSQSTSIKPQ
jgi:hypothetical protein